MDTNSNTTALDCPPLCTFAEEPHRHDVEVDDDGRVVVSHGVDFAPHVYGSLRVDVRTDEVVDLYIGIIDVEHGDPNAGLLASPARLRTLSAGIMDAADWLEARQAEQVEA